MSLWNRRTLAFPLAAAAAALTMTAPGAEAAGTATGTATGTAAPPVPVTWSACEGKGLDPRQECATVSVPLDYRAPDGPRLDLAVSRIRSEHPDRRRGALLLIPGGPGGSSWKDPSAKLAKLPRSVRDTYDIVGFDPRGVGRSAPISCGLSHEDVALTAIRAWPGPGGDISRNAASARRTADACLRDGGPVLRGVSTVNEARDIDSVRRALGEEKLSAWGVSYGTYVGSVYATMFPDRTDRVVLDSNDDPNPALVERGWLANAAVGAEDRFPDFAKWATARERGADRLARTPAEIRPLFLRLAARLDRHPLPWPGANPAELNGNVLRQTLYDALYDDGRFAALAQLIRAAADPGHRALPAPAGPSDATMQNSAAMAVATLCNDVSWPKSVPAYAEAVAANRTRYPLTAGQPAGITPCAFWPTAPVDKPIHVTPRGPSNILLIQNLRDPATPYSGALKLRHAFGDRARMVAVDAGGHGSYLAHGNACGDALVTAYLATGQRPERDVTCPS
ncbi:alpha/beta hydrolase [Streptomyces sp. NPDC050610]|uniref:alpha/beta hydrolase n=1 Tax=Streptomyces sp. NPDC050610 TaxID=3157097 RepID=UPI003423FE0A